MTKICAECEKLYKEAGYTVTVMSGIPEGNDKCELCRRKRWVKATVLKYGKEKK